MVSASEAADEYRSVLSELTRNDKTQINLLTILAEDYASYSCEIVKVIEELIYTCSVPLKICMLYVVDSIIKNISTTGNYRDHFAKKIVDMIVHVFKESDEKTRSSIYRLRCTWTNIFPKNKLYMIDTKINTIDKAWPIQKIQAALPVQPGGGHVVHINPRFFNGQQAAVAAKPKVQKVKEEPMEEEPHKVTSTTSDSSTSLVVTIENRSPQKQIKKEKPEEEGMNGDKKKEKPIKEIKKEPKAATKEDKRDKEGKTVKKDSTESQKTSRSTKERKPKETKEKIVKENEGIPPDKRKRVSEPIIKKLKQDTGRIPKKNSTKVELQKPESLLTLHVEPPNPNYPQQQQQQQPHSQQSNKRLQQPKQLPVVHPPPVKRPRQSHPLPSHTLPPPQLQQPIPHHEFSSHQQTKLEPTAAPGAHAFRHNVVATSHSVPSMGPNTPSQTVIMDTSFPPPTSIPDQSMMQQQSPMFVDSNQVVQHTILNVTPRLPGVPENNRIFVDGKAYEVFYLDQAAVIERNGLPHRVSFAGPPRDVIIDGVAHRMSFGEQKQVLIDGEMHFLQFGAPSRELYMGNYPFKGAFGGPPIIATINGRRHEIRLCGPPPEVRIDPEPSYELMRYMPAIRQQQQSQQQLSPKVETPKEPTLDLTSLLKRLKNSGVLTQVSEAERRTHVRHTTLEAKGTTTIGRSDSPPIPCAHRLDHIERRATPTAGFDQFSMRSLIIRYDSFIEAIHRQRKSCQHCGIRFQELYGEAYQRHVDWHLQNTINSKDPRHKYTRSQPWFLLEDWFSYSETEMVNKTQSTETEKAATTTTGAEQTKGSPQGGQLVADSNRDAPSDSIQIKECQICHEQFEEYWDGEEDIWRLRDCIIVDGKAFHAGCRDDAPTSFILSDTLISQQTDQTIEDSMADDCDMRMPNALDIDEQTKKEAIEERKNEEEEETEEGTSAHFDTELNFPLENKGTEGEGDNINSINDGPIG